MNHPLMKDRSDLIERMSSGQKGLFLVPQKSDQEENDNEERGKITLTGDAFDHTTTILTELRKNNDKSPELFLRGGQLVRLVDRTKKLTVDPLDKVKLKAELLERFRFFTLKPGQDNRLVEKPHNLTNNLCELILATRVLDFPRLTRVVSYPVFGPSGELVTESGYHDDAEVFLDIGNLEIPAVPSEPSTAEIDRAKSLLFDDFLVDFPFPDEASRTHAIVPALSAIVRPMVHGPTPLHLFSATGPGAGKSRLVECLCWIVTGRNARMQSVPKSEAEWKKTISAKLYQGPAFAIFDNVDAKLDSHSLASVLTSEEWSDRLLGRNDTQLILPNRSIWVATGNNPSLSRELARRSVLIRLEPKEPNPWLREPESFKHPQLNRWVAEHRTDLLWAFLILVQHWLARGAVRDNTAVMGTYEDWSGIIGGILKAAEIEGFLENKGVLYRDADVETQEWECFVAAWWERYKDKEQKATNLLRIVEDEAIFHDILEKKAGGQAAALGLALKKHEGRIYDGRKIVRFRDTRNKVHNYRLKAVETGLED